ncbi:MAG: hypothetical protein QXH42_02320 [Thermoplasmata archaeon]
MKVAIIYHSRYGNGKKCVDCVENLLKSGGHEVIVLSATQSSPAQIPPAELYIFSGATEAFSIARPLRTYLKGLPRLDGKRYGLINTHAMKKPRALPKMEKILSGKKGMVKVAEIDFRVGEGTDKGMGLPPDYEQRLAEWVKVLV